MILSPILKAGVIGEPYWDYILPECQIKKSVTTRVWSYHQSWRLGLLKTLLGLYFAWILNKKISNHPGMILSPILEAGIIGEPHWFYFLLEFQIKKSVTTGVWSYQQSWRPGYWKPHWDYILPECQIKKSVATRVWFYHQSWRPGLLENLTGSIFCLNFK